MDLLFYIVLSAALVAGMITRLKRPRLRISRSRSMPTSIARSVRSSSQSIRIPMYLTRTCHLDQRYQQKVAYRAATY
jgi:hypothetical protein